MPRMLVGRPVLTGGTDNPLMRGRIMNNAGQAPPMAQASTNPIVQPLAPMDKINAIKNNPLFQRFSQMSQARQPYRPGSPSPVGGGAQRGGLNPIAQMYLMRMMREKQAQQGGMNPLMGNRPGGGMVQQMGGWGY